jgi:hypothetical protein
MAKSSWCESAGRSAVSLVTLSLSRCKNESVPATTDYRTDPSPSPEGHGHARDAWEHYHLTLASHEVGEAYGLVPTTSPADLDPLARDDLFAALVEESELLGFWLAWHRAGGFAHLEYAGWNRATIFRRIRRFPPRLASTPTPTSPTGSRSTSTRPGGIASNSASPTPARADDVQA